MFLLYKVSNEITNSVPFWNFNLEVGTEIYVKGKLEVTLSFFVWETVIFFLTTLLVVLFKVSLDFDFKEEEIWK